VKHLDAYRDPGLVHLLVERIASACTQPWTIMEICGGQTHSIVKHGLQQLLPSSLRLIHGPGCPVCVTDVDRIDLAIALSLRPDVVVCSFGDMLRVPGSERSLLQARAGGGRVRLVYSPLQAVTIAEQNPEQQIVFFAVGFETTAPTTAMAVLEAKRKNLKNFSVLTSHVQVPPALQSMLGEPDHEIDGILAAGHVCTVMGLEQYHGIARQFGVPIVATGFEPVDILEGIWRCVEQLEQGRSSVENQYNRAVRTEGNEQARRAVDEVFVPSDQPWRGIGTIAGGGLALRPRYAEFDALGRFELQPTTEARDVECISGLVLLGKRLPRQCPAFGTRCTPDHPLGAPMVSSEGACAAYFRYGGTESEGAAR